MFSKAYSISLLQDAKSLVKTSKSALVLNIIADLTKKKLSKGRHDNYYNNLFRFCCTTLKKAEKKDFFIKELNSMLNFIESCDIMENCRSFIPENARISSNISDLHNYIGRKADMVLIQSRAVSPDFVVLNYIDAKLLALVKKKNIPVYLVTSIFNIDVHSLYSSTFCFPTNLFNGVISEHGFEKFTTFIENSEKSFPWLFF